MVNGAKPWPPQKVQAGSYRTYSWGGPVSGTAR